MNLENDIFYARRQQLVWPPARGFVSGFVIRIAQGSHCRKLYQRRLANSWLKCPFPGRTWVPTSGFRARLVALDAIRQTHTTSQLLRKGRFGVFQTKVRDFMVGFVHC
jgi:hypothetical protein